jgi:putative transposase
MPNTYTQVYIQFVFAVKHRQSLIHPSWKEELHKYITGIVKNNGHLVLCINSMPDHLHLFVILKTEQSLSNLMKDVKGDSSKWINNSRFLKHHFEWQSGYGAFSYNPSDIPRVINYIERQEEHHKKNRLEQNTGNFWKNMTLILMSVLCFMTLFSCISTFCSAPKGAMKELYLLFYDIWSLKGPIKKLSMKSWFRWVQFPSS